MGGTRSAGVLDRDRRTLADPSFPLTSGISLHVSRWGVPRVGRAGRNGTVAFGVVGREAQLGELTRAIDAGSFRAVELVGEPGMGKTALLAALRAAASDRGARVAAGK